MKSAFVLIFALAAATGCDRHESAHHSQPEPQTLGLPPSHTEEKGILLADLTKECIGLKTAAASAHLERNGQIVLAPRSAVLNTTAGSSVYLQAGAHYKRQPVKVGRSFGDKVEIIEGISEGDLLVTESAQTLWLIELRAVKGGKGCCPLPNEPKSTSLSHPH